MWSKSTTNSLRLPHDNFHGYRVEAHSTPSDATAQTILQIKEPCPTHSVCNPLPLFRVYKIDDDTFEAQWNGYHEEGTKQLFRFEAAG